MKKHTLTRNILATTALVLGILGLLATSSPVSAQGRVWFGGGGSFPVSDYGDVADPGYLVVVGIGRSIGDSGLNIGVEFLQSENSQSDGGGAETKPNGLTGVVGYDFAGPNAGSSPYVRGHLGFLFEDEVSCSFLGSCGPDAGLALGAGAGFYFPLPAAMRGRVEGRVMHASVHDVNTSFFGLLAYISIPLRD